MRNKVNSLIVLSLLLSFEHAKGQIPRTGYLPADIMKQHAALPAIRPYVGDVTHAVPNHSAGNAFDGDGYYLMGSIPWSVIYYISRTRQAFANWGEIRMKYNSLNDEHSFLGWPGDDEKLLPDGTGLFQRFNRGYIYWSPQYGAHVVQGAFFNYWARNNWEKGVFGYPLEDEFDYPVRSKDKSRTSYQKFYNGIIYITENLITHQISESAKIYNPDYNPSRPH